jgi:response regulator RpfG family c-di-GMP phosphodiesterase
MEHPMSKEPALGVVTRATVLVVDDEPQVLRALVRDLRTMNYQPVAASDPSIALAMLEARHFDAVLTDLQLPVPSGGVFASLASRLNPKCPVVVITGEDSLRRIEETLGGAAVDAILPKPYQRDRLGDVIGRAIAHRREGVADPELEARIIADGLVRALALRDIETENHSRRVSAWARILGRALGLTGDELLQCELGALLHDVGKIGVADAILRKPGKLTEDEWVEMRKHPGYGREMVGGIGRLTGASEVVFGHHERWDGAGYPHGLSGEKIPVGARVFAVVDTYDAMTSDRCYRKGLPHQVAIDEIRSLAGKQYDPHIVNTFLEIDEDEWRAVRSRFEDPSLAVQAA